MLTRGSIHFDRKHVLYINRWNQITLQKFLAIYAPTKSIWDYPFPQTLVYIEYCQINLIGENYISLLF